MDERLEHNYGIDLLRIVAMLMIVAHHFSLHSGIEFEAICSNSVFMSVMALGGKTGVNIFILITGFYSIGKNKVKGKKIFDLVCTTTLYSMVLTVVAILSGVISINKKNLIKSCVPLLFGNNYWFIVAYLELYLLVPLLNEVINNLNRRSYKRYIIGGICLLCVMPSVIGRFIQINDFGYSALVWFVYIYFVGAYLRLYVIPKIGGGVQKPLVIITSGLILVHIAACIANQFYSEATYAKILLECLADYNMNALLPVCISVFLFLVFERIKICKNKRIVRKVGAATLGVYLFHDNVNFRVLLWNICKLVLIKESHFFIVGSVLCIFIIFISGTITEIMKEVILEKIGNIVRNRYRRKHA